MGSQGMSSALSVEPSGWVGNDGSWSAFEIQAGTPPQTFSLLPATNAQHTYLPSADDCRRAPTPSTCGASRGVSPFASEQSPGFQTNASTSWQLIGLYEIGVNKQLGWTGNGIAGYEAVTLQTSATTDTTLRGKQIVTSYATTDVWVGMLGLGYARMTLKPGEREASMVEKLQEGGVVPSAVFGYTAGARYRDAGASLTLGGYDGARIMGGASIQVPVGDDPDRPLMVGLQGVVATDTLNGTLSLLHEAILVPIDSSVSELWLPEDVCDKFAVAFGLQYQNASGRYAISAAKRQQLKELNPKVTVTVSDALVKGSSLNIDFPYAAFDMNASYPIFADETFYFPIRRAMNSSQYVLGRTFLQETYLRVDYEREHFNLSQASFDATAKPNIITVLPSNYTSNSTNGSTSSASKGLPVGAIVGIVAGIIVVLALIAALSWYLWGRRSNRREGPWEKDGQAHHYKHGEETTTELSTEQKAHEMDTRNHALVEVDGGMPSYRHELAGADQHKMAVEMDGHGKPKPWGVYELQ